MQPIENTQYIKNRGGKNRARRLKSTPFQRAQSPISFLQAYHFSLGCIVLELFLVKAGLNFGKIVFHAFSMRILEKFSMRFSSNSTISPT